MPLSILAGASEAYPMTSPSAGGARCPAISPSASTAMGTAVAPVAEKVRWAIMQQGFPMTKRWPRSRGGAAFADQQDGAGAYPASCPCGRHLLGENKIQEAMDKHEALAGLDIRWSIVGHPRTNKVRQLARLHAGGG